MKYIALSILLLGAFSSAAATELSDTVMTAISQGSVIITDDAKGIKVDVVDTDSTLIDSYSQSYPRGARISRSQRWNGVQLIGNSRRCDESAWQIDGVIGSIDLGFLMATGAPEAMQPETGRSGEVGIENIVGVNFKSPLSRGWQSTFSIGVGLNWRWYKMTRHNVFDADKNGVVHIDTEGIFVNNSRLNTFSIQFPILYTLSLPCTWWGSHPSITVGGILNWNTYAGVTYTWLRDDEVEASNHFSGLHQRRFTADVIAKLHILPAIGVFVRYCPMTPFKSEWGPQYHPLSVGISLF